MNRLNSTAWCASVLTIALGVSGCASSAPDEGTGSAGQNIQTGAALRSPIAAGIYASSDGGLLVRVSNTSISTVALLAAGGQSMMIGDKVFSRSLFCDGLVDVALGGTITVKCEGGSIPVKVSAITKTGFTLQKGDGPAVAVSSTPEALRIVTPPTDDRRTASATMTAIDADGISLDIELAGAPQPSLKVAWETLTSDLNSKRFTIGACEFFAGPVDLSMFVLVPTDTDCIP